MLASILMGVMVAAAPKSDPCNDSTTYAVNMCLAGRVERTEAQMNKYLEAALKRFSKSGGEVAVALGIQAAQSAFESYGSTECKTVYEDWKTGTIRER